jgi:hypothetical protein
MAIHYTAFTPVSQDKVFTSPVVVEPSSIAHTTQSVTLVAGFSSSYNFGRVSQREDTYDYS